MDAFFSGLDSRLRVAVKVADSIMVGLVNAAMEDAYKKSLWKDGDLERLFQKLRFAELAIMQLEWCLRFVRGEMEADGGADDGHEQLLDDLLETRDQIQARLDEAELAVAQADCDYMRRKRDDLDPSRRCRETPSAVDRRGAEVEVGAFAELRGSVGRKMTRMRARLEDASSELAALMQKVSGEASPMARLQDPGHEGDGVKGVSGFYSMAQLLMEFQEMVLDAGVVRDSVASAFDAMERSVSAQREAMEEQRWLMDAEKEMYRAVVEGFLREINVESTKCDRSEGEGCPTPTLHHSRGANENSSDEFQSLKDETSQLHSARLIPAEKSESGRLYYNSEEHRISQEEAERLTERTIDSEIRCELQHVLYSAVFRDLLRKLSVKAYDAQELTEQRDEMEIRSNLQYEIHSIMFQDLVKNLGVESVDHLIKTSIEDEVHTALLAKTMNAWKITTEMVQSERLIKEEMDCIIFGGFINDLVNGQNLSVVKSQHQNRPSDNLGRFGMIDYTEQLEKGNIQVNVTTEDEGVGSDQHRVLVDQEVLGIIDNCDRQNPRGSDKKAEASTGRDDAYDSGNCNFEEGLDDRRKRQTEEIAIGLCMPSEGVNQEMCIPLTNIYEIFMDFETIACGKIGRAVLRLRDLDKQLSNLIEQVNSVKTSELIYRRAFTRRCCDLQTAEAEVDLLGDEVELLLGLLSKTYRALEHYSPVLQHYVGIREMMNLLGKELAVRLSH
ncbi:uncharacterized protein [Miscanthus floridulus]|uniref:uncharacterized protein isoform X1 n=1 Tax=Miscanthus floridulus TaxID=154761 RepID=UPI0034578A93